MALWARHTSYSPVQYPQCPCSKVVPGADINSLLAVLVWHLPPLVGPPSSWRLQHSARQWTLEEWCWPVYRCEGEGYGYVLRIERVGVCRLHDAWGGAAGCMTRGGVLQAAGRAQIALSRVTTVTPNLTPTLKLKLSLLLIPTCPWPCGGPFPRE